MVVDKTERCIQHRAPQAHHHPALARTRAGADENEVPACSCALLVFTAVCNGFKIATAQPHMKRAHTARTHQEGLAAATCRTHAFH